MKKLFNALAAAAMAFAPIGTIAAEKEPDLPWGSTAAMGCMMLRECTSDVFEIKTLEDFMASSYYPRVDFEEAGPEIEELLAVLKEAGVTVYMASERYFPPLHRGVYHTVSNNFYLNDIYMDRPDIILSVMRHEGWHAAQDCMAGTIDNSIIAVIYNDEEVPWIWKERASSTYPESVVPWEQEAAWAAHTPDMTINALKACAKGNMWETYEPTPLTRQYLIDQGFIKP